MEETMGGCYRRAATSPRPRNPKEPTGGGPGGNGHGRDGRRPWDPPVPRPPRRHHVAAPECGPEIPTMGTGHAPADGTPSVATTNRAPHSQRERTGAVCMRGFGRCVFSPPRPQTPTAGGGLRPWRRQHTPSVSAHTYRACPLPLGMGRAVLGTCQLSCGNVEAHPAPPSPDWGEEYYAVLPDLVLEACAHLGFVPVRDVFATQTNRRFVAFCTKAEDAFVQAWDYPSAGALRANPPFSRLDDVVTKTSREGCMMLVVAPEWSGPG